MDKISYPYAQRGFATPAATVPPVPQQWRNSIVVIGVSERPTNMGRDIVANRPRRALLQDFPAIAEVDINPLIVLEK